MIYSTTHSNGFSWRLRVSFAVRFQHYLPVTSTATLSCRRSTSLLFSWIGQVKGGRYFSDSILSSFHFATVQLNWPGEGEVVLFLGYDTWTVEAASRKTGLFSDERRCSLYPFHGARREGGGVGVTQNVRKHGDGARWDKAKMWIICIYIWF